MNHRELQRIAYRLITSLKIAEANESHNQAVRDDALGRARKYLAQMDAMLEDGSWVCDGCGAKLPGTVASCGDCQREVMRKARERAL
jgi:hypothetical protein